jgi:ribonuclease Z
LNIKILGSNSASPAHGRHPSSQMLELDNSFYMIDCGEGTQFRLIENHLSYQKIEAIFISHLHGDHYLGLIGLLTTMSMNNREKKLDIIAPKGLKEIIDVQCLYSKTILRFPIEFHVIDTLSNQKIWENELMEVFSIPLVHKIETSGFLFKEKPKKRNIIKEKIQLLDIAVEDIIAIKNGADFKDKNGQLHSYESLTYQPHIPKTYAYCSDTEYSETIIPIVSEIDLLYHEATFMDVHKARAAETKHSTTVQAATIAQKSNVKNLLIGHYSSRYENLDGLLDEAKGVFINTKLALEGDWYSV